MNNHDSLHFYEFEEGSEYVPGIITRNEVRLMLKHWLELLADISVSPYIHPADVYTAIAVPYAKARIEYFKQFLSDEEYNKMAILAKKCFPNDVTKSLDPASHNYKTVNYALFMQHKVSDDEYRMEYMGQYTTIKDAYDQAQKLNTGGYRIIPLVTVPQHEQFSADQIQRRVVSKMNEYDRGFEWYPKELLPKAEVPTETEQQGVAVSMTEVSKKDDEDFPF